MNLLRVESLHLSINGKPILHDVDFTLNAGETLGIIGESGSGKSLSALAVMQLLPQGSETSGQILFDGETLLGKTEAQMCDIRGDDIGMIFQEPMTALNPVQTIGAQVAETVIVHQRVSRKAAMRIAAKTLEHVELPNDEFPLTRYPHELSGGQRQRVVIAMAIALQPRLLIADEPTTALDVTTQAQVLELLKRLTREHNMGLVLISHDLGVVADIADHMVIMRHGNIVDRGLTETVFEELKHPYTQSLYEASGHVPERVVQLTQPQELLVVDSVSRDYRLPRSRLFSSVKKFRAVNNVSFVINRGENVGLVGESGCGKSTLARAILGLERLQAGSITIDGDQVLADMQMPATLRRKVQVVFQDPFGSFNPRHKVGRLIGEPFYLLDKPPGAEASRQLVYEVLDNVGLAASDADKYVHEFSGGQRQRIAIARALIIKPELIVLDEPVSALDVSIRAQILDLLAALSAHYRLSYLFISHDLTVVRSVTDRVLVMKDGCIVEQGETDEVFTSPRHAYTKNLLNCVPVVPGRMTA